MGRLHHRQRPNCHPCNRCRRTQVDPGGRRWGPCLGNALDRVHTGARHLAHPSRRNRSPTRSAGAAATQPGQHRGLLSGRVGTRRQDAARADRHSSRLGRRDSHRRRDRAVQSRARLSGQPFARRSIRTRVRRPADRRTRGWPPAAGEDLRAALRASRAPSVARARGRLLPELEPLEAPSGTAGTIVRWRN